jgi:5'-nucleotidase
MEISGTVGAALTAGRMGIPAIAVSQQRDSTDYTAAAKYVANLVEDFRTKKRLGKKLTNKNGLEQFAILNINVPTCSAGSIRGVEVVPLAQLRTVTGYEPDPNGLVATTEELFIPAILGTADCESTEEDPANDLEAFLNGYISVTPLNPDMTVDNKLRRFKFLRKISFED